VIKPRERVRQHSHSINENAVNTPQQQRKKQSVFYAKTSRTPAPSGTDFVGGGTFNQYLNASMVGKSTEAETTIKQYAYLLN